MTVVTDVIIYGAPGITAPPSTDGSWNPRALSALLVQYDFGDSSTMAFADTANPAEPTTINDLSGSDNHLSRYLPFRGTTPAAFNTDHLELRGTADSADLSPHNAYQMASSVNILSFLFVGSLNTGGAVGHTVIGRSNVSGSDSDYVFLAGDSSTSSYAVSFDGTRNAQGRFSLNAGNLYGPAENVPNPDSPSGSLPENEYFLLYGEITDEGAGAPLEFNLMFAARVNDTDTGLRVSMNGNARYFVGLSAIPSAVDRQRLEGFIAHEVGLTSLLPNSHPYKTAAPVVLDFSGLPNLPQSQRVAVEAAARTVDESDPQRVIDAIAASYWINGVGVVANGQVSGTIESWGLSKTFSAPAASQPVQAAEGLTFDGADDYLSGGTGIDFENYASIVVVSRNVAASPTTNNAQGIFGFGLSATERLTAGFGIFTAVDNFTPFQSVVGNFDNRIDSTEVISTGEFNIYTTDWRGTRFSVFKNGLQVDQKNITEDSSASSQSTWELRIGERYGAGFSDPGAIVFKGLFLANENREILERFASAYYLPIDFSGLPNLPTAQQAAVEAAARTVDTINPQRVIALLAGSYWWHGLEVAANGQPVSSLSSWAQSRDLSSSGSNRPTQAANGLTFDGVDDYLDGGNSPLIPATGNFAAVFVLNKSSAEDAARIIFNQYYLSGAGRFQIFYLTSNNESRVFFSLDGGAGENVLVSRDSFHLLSFGRNGNEGFIRVNTNGLTSDITGASILQSGFLIGARTTSGSTYNQNLGFFFDGIVQGVLIDPSPTADVDRLERFASAYYGLSIIDFSGLPNLPVSSRPAVEIAVRTVDAINPQSVIDDLAQFQHWLSAALPDTLTRTGAEAVSSWNDVIGSDNAVSDSGRSTDPTYVPAAGGNPAHVEFDGVNDGLIINSLLDLGGTSARTIVIVCKTSNNTVDSAIIQLNATDVGTASGRRYRITPEIAVRVFGAKVFNESLPSNHSVIVIQNPSNASASDMQGYLNGVALTQQALSDFPLNILGSQTSIGFSLGLYGATDIAEILTSNTVISPATLNRISALLNALGSYGITLTSIV